MGLADLIEHVTENSRWRKLVEPIVLLDDLQQREALLAGEIDEVEPAVLTLEQARGEAPLPEILVADVPRDQSVAMATDLLWETYFRYAHVLGRSERSRFLVQWVEFEIALRNALATAPRKTFGPGRGGLSGCRRPGRRGRRCLNGSRRVGRGADAAGRASSRNSRALVLGPPP